MGDILWFTAVILYRYGITRAVLKPETPIFHIEHNAYLMNQIWVKAVRDNEGVLSVNDSTFIISLTGDIISGVAGYASKINESLERVALSSVEKLRLRQERGTLSGSGDNR